MILLESQFKEFFKEFKNVSGIIDGRDCFGTLYLLNDTCIIDGGSSSFSGSITYNVEKTYIITTTRGAAFLEDGKILLEIKARQQQLDEIRALLNHRAAVKQALIEELKADIKNRLCVVEEKYSIIGEKIEEL